MFPLKTNCFRESHFTPFSQNFHGQNCFYAIFSWFFHFTRTFFFSRAFCSTFLNGLQIFCFIGWNLILTQTLNYGMLNFNFFENFDGYSKNGFAFREKNREIIKVEEIKVWSFSVFFFGFFPPNEKRVKYLWKALMER